MQSDTAMRNKYGDSNQQAVPMRSQSASYSKAVPIIKMSPGGPIPHNMTKGFDAPPTLERSGSEHRRAVFLFFPEGRRPRWEVEPSLMVKKDGMILEKQHSRAVTSLIPMVGI